MRLVIRKSALLELAKGLNGDSFEKIKAEIIAHLKGLENQEDEPELAKAAEQLNSGEYMFSHLEKSLSGEWIEKAGYGIGTVRTWRGKKYKKIAQGKWARVYDKIDRGAKNAMTRLIHQAESIDTPEEMMRFVLANKQRFSDANGKPLDIVDRLNAVIDGKTYAGKKASKQTEQKPESRLSERQQKNLKEIQAVLGNNVEPLPEKIEFTRENFNRLFKNGIDSPVEHIKVGEHQFEKMEAKKRQALLAPMADVMKNPAVVIKTADGAKIYAKTYRGDNGNKNVVSVIVDKGDIHVSISTHIERDSQLAKKMDSILYERTESVHGIPPHEKKSQSAINIPQSGGKSSRFEPSDSADIEKKEVIAEPVSQEKERVEFQKTKDVLNEFKQLKNSSSKESGRFSMQGVYYDKENGVLAATDAMRLKVVKVGDLTGFDKSGYVNIDTNGKNIVLKPNEKLNKGSWGFPPYKKVIPGDSAMKIRAKLDNKVLAEKIKAMKADGSVSKREGKGILNTIRIDFEKNGNVMLDGTKIGSIGKQDNDLPSLYMNVHYLTDAISTGKTSVLSLQEPAAGEFRRAMTMNTGCSTSVIMPQGAADKNVDYEKRRAEVKAKKEEKGKKISQISEENKKKLEEKELQKRGLSTHVKKSNSLYDYVQKSIAALRACRSI